MYMLYVDESEDDDVYLVGGVLLPSSKYRKFREQIGNFVENDLKLTPDIEIHADYIWNGRNSFNGWSMDKRSDITAKISEFLGNSNLTRFYGVYKYKHPGEDKIDIYKNLLRKLIKRGADYVSKNAGHRGKQLLLIFDRRSDKKEIYRKSFQIQQEITEHYSSSCCFIDCGYEGRTRYSRLLQSADFVAYWCRQMVVIQRERTLFHSEDDKRKIQLVEDIEELWENKLELEKA